MSPTPDVAPVDPALTAEVINRMVVSTITNALKQPFYRALWAGVDTDAIQEPGDLLALPCVTKAQYRDEYMTRFDHESAHYVIHSSGTTGELTLRHRSRLEATMIDKLLSGRDSREEREPRVGVRLASGMHGMQMPFPTSELWIPAATGTDVALRQCVALLTSTFLLYGRELPPTELAGRVEDVALVAQALRARGEDPRRLRLRTVTVMGAVDETLRRFVVDAFGVRPVERFSTTEIIGGAVRAPDADHHLTDAYVLAEVCDDHGSPVADGDAGHLTMTELYPFVQIQPLIRYRTGDVVERVGSPSPGRVAFRWLGRTERTARVARPGRADLVVGYAPLADALGGLPIVTRRGANPSSTATFGAVGMPSVEVEALDGSGVTVRVGVSVDPFFHRDAARAVLDRVWAELGPRADPDDGLRLRVELLPDAGPGGSGGAPMVVTGRLGDRAAPSA